MKVVDGDTVMVYDKATSKVMHIQMAYIDAPELSQTGGDASKKFLKKLFNILYLNITCLFQIDHGLHDRIES